MTFLTIVFAALVVYITGRALIKYYFERKRGVVAGLFANIPNEYTAPVTDSDIQ